MKFKNMNEKNIDEIRYNPYTEGESKSIRNGKSNEIKRIVAASEILNIFLIRGKQKDALERLKSKDSTKEYTARDVIEEMLEEASEKIQTSKESFDGITLG